MNKPFVNKSLLLERFSGKGGWTYARIPGVSPDKRNKFGWVRVKGFIDDYELKKYNLAPMSDGNMFLPVRAEIRKKIQKQEGDKVKVLLYLDNDEVVVPSDLMECLKDEPKALNR